MNEGLCLGGPLAGSLHAAMSERVHVTTQRGLKMAPGQVTFHNDPVVYTSYYYHQIYGGEFIVPFGGLWIWSEHSEVPPGRTLTLPYALKLIADDYAEVTGRIRGLEK